MVVDLCTGLGYGGKQHEAGRGELGVQGTTGSRRGHLLSPFHLRAGDGTDEGHHPAVVQQEPYQGDGCLLLISAHLTQDVRRRG